MGACDLVYKPCTQWEGVKEWFWPQATHFTALVRLLDLKEEPLKGGSWLWEVGRLLPVDAQKGALWRTKLPEDVCGHCTIVLRPQLV